MKVLLLNTHYDSGGAALAAQRLQNCLRKKNIDATLLVNDYQDHKQHVYQASTGLRKWWNFLWERIVLLCCLMGKRKRLFELNIANTGTDITQLAAFQTADVIHLHWTAQGLLSLEQIGKILATGKAVVWTLHDLWAVRAIDPYCDDYLPLLTAREKAQYSEAESQMFDPAIAQTPLLRWLTARTWQRKQKTYAQGHIHFVACSQYYAKKATLSPLTKSHSISHIPNPIDTNIFCPQSQAAARIHFALPHHEQQQYILFAAFRLTNPNKGYTYLQTACQILVEQMPHLRKNTAILLLGGDGESLVDSFALPAYYLGYNSDAMEIAKAYAAANIFVLPSLSENLPNTIMEAMACARPCLAFGVGGVAEMIDHLQTGYVAQAQNAVDLCQGLLHLLTQANQQAMGKAARNKVERLYAQDAVAESYFDLYQHALSTPS